MYIVALDMAVCLRPEVMSSFNEYEQDIANSFLPLQSFSKCLGNLMLDKRLLKLLRPSRLYARTYILLRMSWFSLPVIEVVRSYQPSPYSIQG